MEHEVTCELIVYHNEYHERIVAILALSGYVKISFVGFLNDPDTTGLILQELECVITDLPESGVKCYKTLLYYEYDEGDDSVGIWPGWTFSFGDEVTQIHPKEEQYYFPEPEYE